MKKKEKISFVILGAQKSATTSLHVYLSNHPDIFMTRPLKEPGYFLPWKVIASIHGQKGFEIENMEELWSKFMFKNYQGQPLIGESSTYYTIGDWSRKYEVPKRMQAYNPNLKFLYITRNPFDRLYSNYKHGKARNYFNMTFREFVLKNSRCVLTSKYYYQMKEYLSVFGRENFLFLNYGDIVNSTASLLQNVSEFLDCSEFKVKALNKQFKAHNTSLYQGKELHEAPTEYMKENMPKIYASMMRDLEKYSQLVDVNCSALL